MGDAPSYRPIRLERDRDVARLTFNRPKQRNALTQAMMDEIADALRRVRNDDKRPPPWAPGADIRTGSVAEQDDGRARP